MHGAHTGLLSLLLLSMVAPAATAEGEGPRVVLETSKGSIVIEVYPDKTPKTAEAVKVILEEIRKLRSVAPTAEEMEP